MKILKALGKWILVLTVSTVMALFMLEIIYRYQWFDFYKTELEGLNPAKELSGKKNILIGGDSFTASSDSWVNEIRKSFPEYAVINSAVPGTGIIQASYILPDRIEKYQPEIFIYQIYAGNDLLDISHPVHSDSISFARKSYWWLSDRLHSLAYINYKLGGAVQQPVMKTEAALADSFSVARYTNREKLQFKAEPALIENSLYLKNGRADDMDLLCERLQDIISKLPKDCKVYFVLVPHAAQTSPVYFRQMKLLGASLRNEIYSETNFPFTEKLKTNFPDAKIIDPLTAFREAEAKGNALFYPNDPHLNAKGQAILGEWVVENL